MGSFTFYGQELVKPKLKFDYSLASAIESDSRRGLRIYGPYDKNLFSKPKIKMAIITDEKSVNVASSFRERLCDGVEGYPGFSRLIRIGLESSNFLLAKNNTADFDQKLREAVQADPDIAFVIVDKYSQPSYSKAKALLLGSGVPCQVINRQTLDKPTDQVQWIYPNIALASYAKVGGTPWVIEGTDRSEVVLGMSRAIDKKRNVLVGFTTIFKENGDYVLYHSKSPVRQWDEYEAGLGVLVQEAVEEYQNLFGQPKSLVIHFHKRTGSKEVRAVSSAIKSSGLDIPYALLHLNSDSSYFPFDGGAGNYAAPQGLQVNLGRRQALLICNVGYGGEPGVVEVTMDRESTMSFDEFPRLLQQVYQFSFVNWRGFGSKAIPVTIYYPYLIARLIAELDTPARWNEIVANTRLLDKAWFL